VRAGGDTGSLAGHMVDERRPWSIRDGAAAVDAPRRRSIERRPERGWVKRPVEQIAAGDVVPDLHPLLLARSLRIGDRRSRQVEEMVAALPEERAVGIVEEALRWHQVVARPVRVRPEQLAQLPRRADVLPDIIGLHGSSFLPHTADAGAAQGLT